MPVLSPKIMQHIVTPKFLQQVVTGLSILLQASALSNLQVALLQCCMCNTCTLHKLTCGIQDELEPFPSSAHCGVRPATAEAARPWPRLFTIWVVVNFKYYLFISPITSIGPTRSACVVSDPGILCSPPSTVSSINHLCFYNQMLNKILILSPDCEEFE